MFLTRLLSKVKYGQRKHFLVISEDNIHNQEIGSYISGTNLIHDGFALSDVKVGCCLYGLIKTYKKL